MPKPPLTLAKPPRSQPQANEHAQERAQAALDASSGTARVVISAAAHRALKIHCATTGRQMKQVLDELLAEKGYK